MIRRIAVVVPAANEQKLIGACLDALSASAAAAPLPTRIVVVLDACTDGTAERAAGYPGTEVVTTSARSVGYARRAGVAHALLHEDPHEVWLANTDADSTVPIAWLARMAMLAESADLVLGTVVPDTGLRPMIERAWFARHRLADGHSHIHGANLGIRGAAYVGLGGWQPMDTGEDVDLVQRAVDAGLRIARTASIPVRTSSRVTGRAPHGFSSYLRTLEVGPAPR